MSGTSYAQNFEDVMLWRALGNVERGRYIDVGAQDPLVDSVSLMFYEHGWRGIHVEPTPAYAELLRQSRPDEIVIQAAAVDKSGLMAFFEFPDTGLSTADPEIAEKHVRNGFSVREIVVPGVTLDEVFSHDSGKEVHWLKIDVEGREEQVLTGWVGSTLRPWVLVIESTLPSSQVKSHERWEPLVLRKGYKFAYFDGLNRFYIADRHAELLKAFESAPNVFDGFVLSGTSPLCTTLNNRLHALEDQLEHERQDSDKRLTMRQAELSEQSRAIAAEFERRLQVATSEQEELHRQLQAGHDEFTKLSQILMDREREFIARESGFAAELRASHQQTQAISESLVARQQEMAQQWENARASATAQKAKFDAEFETSRVEVVSLKAQVAMLEQAARLRDDQNTNRSIIESTERAQIMRDSAALRKQLEGVCKKFREHSSRISDSLIVAGDELRQTSVSLAKSGTMASSLDEMLSLQGNSFVHCAYRTLLRREPDPTGLHFYLTRIRAGLSKHQTIAEIALSAEGKAQNVELEGLQRTLRLYKLRRVPIFGRVIGWLVETIWGSSKQREIRALEQRIYRLSEEREEHNKSIGRIQARILELQRFVQAKDAYEPTVSIADEKTSSTGQSAPALLELTNLSENARDAHVRLMDELQAAKGTCR